MTSFKYNNRRLTNRDGATVPLTDRQRCRLDFDNAAEITAALRYYANMPLHIEFEVTRAEPCGCKRAFLLEMDVPAVLSARTEHEIAHLMLFEALAWYACEVHERPLPVYS